MYGVSRRDSGHPEVLQKGRGESLHVPFSVECRPLFIKVIPRDPDSGLIQSPGSKRPDCAAAPSGGRGINQTWRMTVVFTVI